MLPRNTLLPVEQMKKKVAAFLAGHATSTNSYLVGAKDAISKDLIAVACNHIGMYCFKLNQHAEESPWYAWAAGHQDIQALWNLSDCLIKIAPYDFALAADLCLEGWNISRDDTLEKDLGTERTQAQHRKDFEDTLKIISLETKDAAAQHTAEFALNYIAFQKDPSQLVLLEKMNQALLKLKSHLNTDSKKHRFWVKQTLLAELIKKTLRSAAEKDRPRLFDTFLTILNNGALADAKVSLEEKSQGDLRVAFDNLCKEGPKKDIQKLKLMFKLAPAETKDDLRSKIYLQLTREPALTLDEKHSLAPFAQTLSKEARERQNQVSILVEFRKNFLNPKQIFHYISCLCDDPTHPDLSPDVNSALDDLVRTTHISSACFLLSRFDDLRSFRGTIANRLAEKFQHEKLFADSLSECHLRQLSKQFNLTDTESFRALSFEQLAEIVVRVRFLSSTYPSAQYKPLEQTALGCLIGSHHERLSPLSGVHPLSETIEIIDAFNNPKKPKELSDPADPAHPLIIFFKLQRAESAREINSFCVALDLRITQKHPVSDCFIPPDIFNHMKQVAITRLNTVAKTAGKDERERASRILSFFSPATTAKASNGEYKKSQGLGN